MKKKAATDKLVIPTNWTFQNSNVAENFDAHVREQLPWYDLATGVVAHVGRHFLPERGLMYDIGASTGNITKILSDVLIARTVDTHSIEYSNAMEVMWDGYGSFHNADARSFEYERFDFAVCFLVLMFMTPEDQMAILDRLYRKLKVGGAILVFDKCEAACGYVGTIMHSLTLAGKIAQGAEPAEVIQKELSLAGVQRPIIPTALLSKYNATEIFRFGEFAGWVITN